MMKKKKLLSLLMVVVMCLGLCAQATAALGSGVVYTAQADRNQFGVSAADQMVTVTVDADQPITWDGVGFKVYYDAPLQLVGIVNKEVALTDDDRTIGEGSGKDGAGFWPLGSGNSTMTNIAVLTFKIPAGTPAGIYALGIKGLEITKDMGTVWTSEAAAMTYITLSEKTVEYSAVPDQRDFIVSSADQTVTVTVDAGEQITWDGIGFKVYYDTPLQLVGITNKEVTLTDDDRTIGEGSGTDGAGFWPAGSGNSTMTNIAVLTFKIPAGTPAGTYALGIKELEITKDMGTVWQTGAAAMTSITVGEYDVVVEDVDVSGDQVAVTFSNLPDAESGTCEVLVASYDADGRMISIGTEILSGLTVSVDLPGAAAADQLSVFTVDSKDCPIAPVFTK